MKATMGLSLPLFTMGTVLIVGGSIKQVREMFGMKDEYIHSNEMVISTISFICLSIIQIAQLLTFVFGNIRTKVNNNIYKVNKDIQLEKVKIDSKGIQIQQKALAKRSSEVGGSTQGSGSTQP